MKRIRAAALLLTLLAVDRILVRVGLGQPAVVRHVQIGHRLLSHLPEFFEGAELVLSHHERHDGKGYRRGLAGDELPIEVSVISVADSYDAMTTDRPYRRGLPWAAVRAELVRGRDTLWRVRAVDAFVEMIEADRASLMAREPEVAREYAQPA